MTRAYPEALGLVQGLLLRCSDAAEEGWLYFRTSVSRKQPAL